MANKRVGENKDRMQLYISEHIKEYIATASDKFGISQSAFVTMCVQQYKQNERAVEFMQEGPVLMKKIEELDKKYQLALDNGMIEEK